MGQIDRPPDDAFEILRRAHPENRTECPNCGLRAVTSSGSRVTWEWSGIGGTMVAGPTCPACGEGTVD